MSGGKQVLIDIDIRAEDIKAAQTAMSEAQKKAALFVAELAKLRKEQMEANALYKVGAVSLEEYAKTQVSLTTQTKEATKGLQAANKEYANNKIVVDAAKGSNEQMKAQLSLLTKELDSMGAAEVKTSARGAELQGQILGLTNKLKENEGAVGNNRRSVGNYEGAIKSVLGSLSKSGGTLGGFAKGLDGVSSGFKAAGGGVKGFGAALMSLGLPLIITGVSALVNIFKSFTPIVDVVENAVTGLKAAFGALISGGNISEAVKQSRALLEVMRDLEDTEKAFAIQAEKQQNQVAKLIVQSKDRTKTEQERLAIIKQANEIEDAYHKESIARIDKAVNAAQSEFMRKNDISVKEMKLLAEGTTAQATALRERLEKTANYNAEELIVIQDQLTKKEELNGKSLVLQEKLANRESQLIDQLKEEKQKELDAERDASEKAQAMRDKLAEKQAAQKAKELAESQRVAAEMKAIADEFAREQMSDLERREADALARVEILRKAGVDEVEIQKYLSETLVGINRDEQAAILQGKLESLGKLEIQQKDIVNREIENADARALAMIEIELKSAEARSAILAQGAIDYQASLDVLNEVDAVQSEKILEDKATVDNEIVELERQKSEAIIALQDGVDANAKANADSMREKQKEAFAATAGLVTDVLGGIQSLMQGNIKAIEDEAKAAGKSNEQIARMTKAARKEAHDMAVAAAVVQTLLATIAAYQSAVAVPLVGTVLAPIAAAAAFAFGMANVGMMAKEKFAEGGVLQGASHAQGGIPITVDGRGGYEAEGDEIVLTKNVYRTPKLRQMASDLNVAAGGVPIVSRIGKFALGGALGGSATFAANNAAANSVMSASQMSAIMSDALSNQPAPIVRVTDINRVSNDMRRVQASSEMR
jgi:hypothetical protein